MRVLLLIITTFLVAINAKIYLQDSIDEQWELRWTQSSNQAVKHGRLVMVKPELLPDSDNNYLKTGDGSSYYQYGSHLSESLDTSKSDFFFNYVVYHSQDLDCGGSYVKFYEPNTDFSTFDSQTNYVIMFGMDSCGYSTRKIHFILNHNGTNHELTKEIPAVLDRKPHLYSLRLFTNKSFEVLVDNVVKRNGTLFDEFAILLPKLIDDPNDKKPDNWVDERFIDDSEDKKPEDWVDEKTIIDPDAHKPDDWNDETEGEWQQDVIPNPKYKGEWSPKKIDNPAYKGEWKAKQIENPDYKFDDSIGKRVVGGVAVEVWQVTAGTHFDEFFVADSLEEANAHADMALKEIKALSEAIEKKEAADREKVMKEQEGKKKSDEEAEEDESSQDVTEDEEGSLNAENGKQQPEVHIKEDL